MLAETEVLFNLPQSYTFANVDRVSEEYSSTLHFTKHYI